MKLYEVSPKKDARKLALLTGALLIGGFVLMAVTVTFGDVMSYKWGVQLVSVGMLALGVFFTTRYSMRSYIYAIDSADEGADLTVTEVHGRHVITVCRISVSGIEEVFVACPSDRNEMNEALSKVKKDKRKQYNYCVDMFGQQCIFVLANECGESVAIRLSYDERLYELLMPNTNN